MFEQTGLVAILDVDATIVKSDSKITDELRGKLIQAVRVLENVPEKNMDWYVYFTSFLFQLFLSFISILIYPVSFHHENAGRFSHDPLLSALYYVLKFFVKIDTM